MSSRVPLLALVSLLAACRSTPSAPASNAPVDPAAPRSSDAAAAAKVGTDPGGVGYGTPLRPREGNELAAFAGGCFWGTEATFRAVPGVVATAVGYTGGHTSNPDYESVSSHTTGHAETVLVEFDPKRVSYAELLRVFWDHHDPTTKDRQGPDVGSNYRSEIFVFSPEQDWIARASMADEQKKLDRPIVTQIAPIGPFYLAEDYHQQYHEKTGTHACPTGRSLGGT